jgi:peroxiredoxin
MTRLTLIILLMNFTAAPAAPHQAIQEPSPAPQFALKELSGKSVSLSDYKGKVVLLNFWATWCVPCRAEIPDLVRLQKEYQSRGLQILGITYPAYTRRGVQQIVDRLKINYPILLADRSFADMYGVEEVLPTTIVIDREGKIRGRILGIMEAEEFDQSVKPLLDK